MIDLPKTSLRTLLSVMKGKTSSISKRTVPEVLGIVGKEAFEKVKDQYSWVRLRYTNTIAERRTCPVLYHDDDKACDSSEHVEYPYIVELAVFDRQEDGLGLKVFQCVNFMASMEDIFSGTFFSIRARVADAGIKDYMPITILVHLVCPVLSWLNYGKNSLGD